jgi:hypothetical protein
MGNFDLIIIIDIVNIIVAKMGPSFNNSISLYMIDPSDFKNIILN